MKAFYLLLLATCPGSTRAGAQQLRGGYTGYAPGHSQGQMQQSFYWFSEGRFQFATDGCTLFECGSGTYELTRDSLILHYDSLAPFAPPATTTDTTSPVRLSVRVWDAESQQPLPEVTIVKSHTTIAFTAKGTGWTHLPDTIASGDTIEVNGIGYQRQKVRVPARNAPFNVVLLPVDLYLGGRSAYLLTAWRSAFQPAGIPVNYRWRRAIQERLYVPH